LTKNILQFLKQDSTENIFPFLRKMLLHTP
jgi:hypothetical protein